MGIGTLDEWIEVHIRPLLLSHGFEGRRRSYKKRGQDGCLVIEFQRSRDSWEGRDKLAVNFGAWNARIARAESGAPTKCPGWSRCHVALRLGDLGPERAEQWWVLTPDTNERDAIAVEVRRRLESEALPFLSPLLTDAGMKAFWRTQHGELSSYYLGLLSQHDHL